MNKENYVVLVKIVNAVETGGQIYGNARYTDYTAPYANTPNEHTITLGAGQHYGASARKLIQMIYNADPTGFKKLDTCSPTIQSMLSKDWVSIRWNPNSSQKTVLIKLISSTVGIECQDKLLMEELTTHVNKCESTYTKDTGAVMMYVEIAHLGGSGAAKRIFDRCNKNYSLDNIMASLKKDQNDTSSSNQVGDKIFWSRHQKCAEFIKKYAVSEKATSTSTTTKKTEVVNTASALSRAKTLLRMPQGETMTGYTPTGKSYFVSAGAWYTTPKKGDVIYFYSSTKGRVGHVGIVEKVDTANKIVHTVEGNTSSTEYQENGGCVARHSYSYKSIGGTNRVNGFGRPNFEAAGVTVDQFVATAVSFIGYLEKRSNSQLDSKTANAGSNNYQRFQRDVGAGNGDQWCQFWVSAMALYTCQGVNGGTSTATTSTATQTALNESSKFTGYVTSDSLNVRTWAGTENAKCSFSPLAKGTAVGVCDVLKDSTNNDWYYILYDNKHGFVLASRISKTKPAVKKEETVKKDVAKNATTTKKTVSTAYKNETVEKNLSTKIKSRGTVTARSLNVRVWAGTEYDVCSFSPLAHGQKVGICDSVKASNGDKWYYIKWGGKYGFVSAKYIV